MAPRENALRGLAGKFDAFVFDWDGTLSSLQMLRALNEKLNPFWRYKKRRTAKVADWETSEKRHKMDAGLGKRLVTPFIDISLFLMKPKLHNDSRLVLDVLKSRKKTIALFTNGSSYRVLSELTYLGIRHYFSVIVSAQDVNALKPNPLGLKKVLAEIGTPRSKVLYIGDMVDDIAMAKSIRVGSCGIAAGFDSYGKLKNANPDYVFRSMEEFGKAL